MKTEAPESERLLTPAEVATMFRVDPKTVTRWSKAGKLTSIRTLGGHRRYREVEVRALIGEYRSVIPRRADLFPGIPGGSPSRPMSERPGCVRCGSWPPGRSLPYSRLTKVPRPRTMRSRCSSISSAMAFRTVSRAKPVS